MKRSDDCPYRHVGLPCDSGAMDEVRVFARAADGSETDITEGVQALYDLVIGSMDWGSGFWTAEDAAPVAKVARACGFESAEEAERYLREQIRSEERQAFLRADLKTRNRFDNFSLHPGWTGVEFIVKIQTALMLRRNVVAVFHTRDRLR